MTDLDSMIPDTDPIKFSISICFNRAEMDRWNKLRATVANVNPKARMSQFARATLIKMMDDVDEWISEHESKTRP